MGQRNVLIVGDHRELVDAARSEFERRGDVVVVMDEDPIPAASLPAEVEVLVGLYRPVDDPARVGETARRMAQSVGAVQAALAASGAGRIVLGSGRDYLGWPGRAAESADLAAVVGLTRSLALELGREGITVNAVCPPGEIGPQSATEDPWAAPPPPLVGPIEPDDVAFAIAFLADRASGYVTGQIVHVSGGLSVLSSLSS